MLSKYAAALRTGGYRPATIHGHLTYLRWCLRWAVGQTIIDRAPTINMPKVPDKEQIRTITAEEFERLYAKATGAWKLFVATAWYTGMRRNEMLDLTWDNAEMPRVDFKANKIWIPAAYNKSAMNQWIPLHPQLAALMQAEAGTGFIVPFRGVPHEVSRKFTKLARSLGLKISLHDLRRSFGTRYASVVQAPVLQRLMRHSAIQTTMKFYVNVDDALESAIKLR